MRCREVQKQISNDPAGLCPEARQHILLCRSCTKIAEAARVLDTLIADTRDTKSELGFETLKHRVEDMHNQKEQKRAKLRPRYIAVTAVFAVALLALTLIPFSYTKTVGYKVTIPDAGKYCTTAVQQMTSALEAVGYSEADVKYLDETRSYVLSGLPDERGANEIAKGLLDIVDCGGTPVVEADKRITSSTLYAQVVDKVKPDKPERMRLSLTYEDGKYTLNCADLSKVIDADDMTDDEKKRAVWTMLDSLGVSEAIKCVVVKSGEDVETLSFFLAVDSARAQDKTHYRITAKDGEVFGVVLRDSLDELTADEIILITGDSIDGENTIHFEIVFPKNRVKLE